MLTHYHGQTWSSAEPARAFGVAATTVKRYLHLLTGALVVRQVQPWHENLKKRQVRSPKVYVADTGLLHSLLGIETREQVEGHPKVGASWEGFVVGEVIQRLGVRPEECFFWATHAGTELDLLVIRGQQRRGFEIKRTTSPRTTRSMHVALEDLKLDSLTVIHAGTESYDLSADVTCVAMTAFGEREEASLAVLSGPTAPMRGAPSPAPAADPQSGWAEACSGEIHPHPPPGRRTPGIYPTTPPGRVRRPTPLIPSSACPPGPPFPTSSTPIAT